MILGSFPPADELLLGNWWEIGIFEGLISKTEKEFTETDPKFFMGFQMRNILTDTQNILRYTKSKEKLQFLKGSSS